MSVHSDQIYRSIDETGHLSFSDRKSDLAETVDLESISVVSAPSRALNLDNSVKSERENLIGSASYKSFSIASPSDRSTIRNVQEINVQLVLEPKIARDIGHKIVLYLNSEPHFFSAVRADFDLWINNESVRKWL